MPKLPKNFKDALFYAPGSKRGSRPIAGCTVASEGFLVLVHELNPQATISQLREIITDRTQYVLDPEAVEVLDAYIKRGYGNHVPEWR